jgi:spermidine synthase
VAAVDLYVTGQIPPYCATIEFFEQLRGRLVPQGVVMLNVVARHHRTELLEPLVATLSRVFPTVYQYSPQSDVLVATAHPTRLDQLVQSLKSRDVPVPIRSLADAAAAGLVPVTARSASPVFTDDKSDIEERSFRVVHGGW